MKIKTATARPSIIPKLHARTAWGCWRIARRHAEVYQRQMTRARAADRERCQAARDAADKIAREIRYGKTRGPESRGRRRG